MSASEKKMITRYLEFNALKTLDKSSLTSIDTPEYSAFERACSQCHDLPDPLNHTQSEWPHVVQTMVDHMREASIEPPGSEEEKALLRFLKDNAGG
jgi:hypothetical protein